MKTRKLLFSLMLIAFTSSLWAAYPTIQGNGTSGNPYKITTAEELLQVRDSVNTFDSPTSNLAHYELANNINMSAAEWTVPSGVVGRFFKGNFNGNGYKITGLTLGNILVPYFRRNMGVHRANILDNPFLAVIFIRLSNSVINDSFLKFIVLM